MLSLRGVITLCSFLFCVATAEAAASGPAQGLLCHGCATDRCTVLCHMQRIDYRSYLAPRDGTEISWKTPRIPAISNLALHGYPQKHPSKRWLLPDDAERLRMSVRRHHTPAETPRDQTARASSVAAKIVNDSVRSGQRYAMSRLPAASGRHPFRKVSPV